MQFVQSVHCVQWVQSQVPVQPVQWLQRVHWVQFVQPQVAVQLHPAEQFWQLGFEQPRHMLAVQPTLHPLEQPSLQLQSRGRGLAAPSGGRTEIIKSLTLNAILPSF